jgi:4-hydroxybenzoyl-CoA reductase subunit beta
MLRLHPYEYHRPSRVDDALELLAAHGDDAMPIAGGTDLVPNMKHKLFTPGHLVALRGIEEMRGIEEVDGAVRIGASTTLQNVTEDPTVRRHFPALAKACRQISGPQLRRMGTIGGNLCLDTRCTYYNQTRFWRKSLGFCLKKEGDECHVIPGGTRCVAAHSADTPPILMTLGATVEIAGLEGRRELSVDDLFTSDGIWNRRMDPGELITAVTVPVPDEGVRSSFQKLRPRAALDFPILNLAVTARLDGDQRVRELRMVASAMGAYPRTIGKVAEAARGQRLEGQVADTVARQAYRQCHPLENIPVDPEWRKAMVPVLVRRALEEIGNGGVRAP